MGRISIAVWVVLGGGCAGRTVAPAPKVEPLITDTEKLMESIERRMPECELSATMAADQLTVLDQRDRKLKQRCLAARQLCEGYLSRLEEVRITTALAIALMRSDAAECEASKAQVEIWLAAFAGGIEELDGRVDRAEVERSVTYDRAKAVASRHRARLSLR